MQAEIRVGSAAALFVAAFLAGAPARAARLEVGLGAGYWFDQSAVFEGDLALRAGVAGPLSVGGRLGAMLATSPAHLGVPIDLLLRASIGRGYIEAAAGPWILFGPSSPLRAHAAFGFGIQTSGVSVGLEVGWLDPSPQLGLRVAFTL